LLRRFAPRNDEICWIDEMMLHGTTSDVAKSRRAR
jgi:hypothetical protein